MLLPSWAELATIANHPRLWQDRLLILLIAWAGLRWTEAVSWAFACAANSALGGNTRSSWERLETAS